jgi:hypothetical protein
MYYLKSNFKFSIMKTHETSLCKFLLFFILILSTLVAYPQISNDMIKYWYYRNRLNNYYVVPGLKQVCIYRNLCNFKAINCIKHLPIL